ncbi:unnamed protein product [Brachionus calyciflorus]|uniref:Reverse transcriptase domain-containing protein n=1 Tax=Brachionus calyciflorus TaxID=104777 RepID=A0A814N8I7_9BILA|nr:unnamed protein product [Brachionus calyciflorus]
MPFGLRSSPAFFSMLIRQILGNLEFCQVYIDDLVIFSDNVEEHLDHLKQVFDKLYKYKPKTLKQLQSFLGLAYYHRRYVEGYAKIAAPLHALQSPKMQWIWSDCCTVSFENLKNKLTSYSILRQPDINREFKLYTIASTTALRAILSQTDDNVNEYVCFYASRLLKGSERHYSITEIECLAVVWAVNFFRTYLYGKKYKIIVYHYALKWQLTMKTRNARLTRWSILPQTFEFEIIHRKGVLHSKIDALSRPVVDLGYGRYNSELP